MYAVRRLFFNEVINSQELKDCVKDFVKNGGNLFDCVLESLNNGFSLSFGNDGLRIGISVRILVFASFAAAVAIARPNSGAVAAAKASLEVSTLVLCAGKENGFVKIRTISAATAGVHLPCAIFAGATVHCNVLGNNGKGNGKGRKYHDNGQKQ